MTDRQPTAARHTSHRCCCTTADFSKYETQSVIAGVTPARTGLHSTPTWVMTAVVAAPTRHPAATSPRKCRPSSARLAAVAAPHPSTTAASGFDVACQHTAANSAMKDALHRDSRVSAGTSRCVYPSAMLTAEQTGHIMST